MTKAARIQVYSAALDRLGNLMLLADGKAAPVLALHVTLAAVTIAGEGRIGRLFDLDDHAAMAVAVSVALLATYVVSALAVTALVIAIYFPVIQPTGHSHTFFEDIRRMQRDEYVAQSEVMSEEALERELLEQVHGASGILSTKFLQLRWAYSLSAISLMSWVPLMAWANA
jgi:hypothetical protein